VTAVDRRSTRRGGAAARLVVSLVACLLLLGGAAGASWLIFASEPTAEREGATRRSAALVETVTAERGTYRPILEVLGVVEPARDVVLSPRVPGRIVELQSRFLPGGVVTAGEPLVRLDPADFEHLLTARRSELHQVRAELAIERGRQRVARQEYELLGEEIDPSNRALVLREPQIEAIRARMQSAEAAVEQAELDLERTIVEAPFDARILTRLVNVGSQVQAGTPLGRLVGIDEYWIIASVPLRDAGRIRFADEDGIGSRVRVRHETAWEPGVHRLGSASRLIGTVDERSRLAQVLVTVPDPLGRTTDGPPLILGTIVRVRIEGRPLEDVVRLDRDLVRQNDTVWVMADEALEIREAEIVFDDARYAYVRSGIEAGEQIVRTNLATVTEGLALRRAGATDADADADAGAGAGDGDEAGAGADVAAEVRPALADEEASR